MIKAEIWRSVLGYEGLYEVSSIGRVHRIKTGHVSYCTAGRPTNYPAIRLKNARGESKTRYVHQLVALAFVPGYAPGLIVNHKDGNESNNHAENLEWVTVSQNAKHAWSHNGVPRRDRRQISAFDL